MTNLKPVLIVENCLSGLVKNESAAFERKDYILSGTFTEFNIRNRNDRVYTAPKFLPHLNELLERKKTLGVIYGEFDHPDVFDTSLKRVSHTLESLTFNSERNIIEGSIRLLNTTWGKEAKALIDDNCPIFVSSRAAGITESNGEVTIKKLFTYDAVADPGFSSARMALNESLGFNENVNFRIYEMTDESKINQLFTMNNNDIVTKSQMEEYSNYLTSEINKVSEEMKKTINEGKASPEKIEQLTEYYSNLHESFNKVSGYLDYLAESVQFLVNENKSLKERTDNLIKHNDYLVENLNKSMQYSEYLAEKVDSNIGYSEYIAETLSNSIDFSEHIAENVSNNIKYSEYLAEKLDKTIVYSEYIAENVDKSIDFSNYLAENIDNNIAFSEYIAENVDSNIAYSEYLAENLDNSIKYGEYVAEHVDNNIAYSEYIAENLSDTQAYTKYISEGLDKTIDYQKYIAGKIKGSKLNEDLETPDEMMGDLKATNVDVYYEDDEVQPDESIQVQEEPVVAGEDDTTEPTIDGDGVQPIGSDEDQVHQLEPQAVQPAQPAQPVQPAVQSQPEMTIIPGMSVKLDDNTVGEVIATNPQNKIVVLQIDGSEEVKEVQESRIVTILGDKLLETQGNLIKNIATLIEESKKRKASDEKEPHFLLFLGESNKTNWLNLADGDKERVIVAMNESKYTSESDVLRIMQTALNANKKSFTEVVVEKIPESLKPVWESLDAKMQNGILAQIKLYNLNNDEKIESFWNSRGLNELTMISEKKVITSEPKFVDNSELTDTEVDKFISVFKTLR